MIDLELEDKKLLKLGCSIEIILYCTKRYLLEDNNNSIQLMILNIISYTLMDLVNLYTIVEIRQLIKKLNIKKIRYFSKSILNQAIKKGGSSIRDFKNVEGRNGSYQNEFKVYQRENLNCLNKDCSGKIKKKVISKRSTFFCNKCQK